MVDTEETTLEKALRLAADDPVQRPEFYRLLIESPVYVLGDAGEWSGARTLAPGETVRIQNWTRDDGSPVIPFFTSLAALRKAIEAESSYMELPARSLFEMTKGATLVLNPKAAYGKEFLPGEIAALLSNGVNRVAEQRVTTKPTHVLLGQPAEYPEEMVAALKSLFAKRNNVKAAYLAQMHDPSHDDEPHLVVGVEADGDIEQILRDAGVVAGDTAPGGKPLDLYRVERGDRGLSQYFIRQVKPFYERAWSGKLKTLLGIGRD